MGRKSVVTKLPPEVRAHIEKRLREDRLTLDGLFADVRSHFPEVDSPSRSALGRFRKGFDEIVATQRAMQTASQALVAELGEGFDEKAGALLSQAVTTLVYNAADGKLREGGDLEISDVLDLARAAKSAQEARSLSLRERQQVAKMAREKLIEEQKTRLDELEKSGALENLKPAEVLAKVIKAAYAL
ncbi:MAG: DUF3486 family protein [Betaproteobacteria bacterium]|nr:DUF3486 family protein [Betaproteobacteria bacterium]MCL2887421.1 DUF3486 family protein [Betaproteobacteria bacterium]